LPYLSIFLETPQCLRALGFFAFGGMMLLGTGRFARSMRGYVVALLALILAGAL
jgi:hypothetical protein